jgi:hypothetical protein
MEERQGDYIMGPEGQMEILYFYMNQCYSGEQCGPWASCFFFFFPLTVTILRYNISNEYARY